MYAFAVRTFGKAPAIYNLPISATNGAVLARPPVVNPIVYELLQMHRLNLFDAGTHAAQYSINNNPLEFIEEGQLTRTAQF